MAKHKIDFKREFAKPAERLRQDPTLTKGDLVREALEWRTCEEPKAEMGSEPHAS